MRDTPCCQGSDATKGNRGDHAVLSLDHAPRTVCRPGNATVDERGLFIEALEATCKTLTPVIQTRLEQG